jgi:hypothetical protein
MRAFSIGFLTLSLIFVISCTSVPTLKQNEIDPWLNTISGGKLPEIEITGKWRDKQGIGLYTWGQGYLHQEQNKISGVIGDYDIKGVVSGKIVYLVFLNDDTVYYTARLEMVNNLLTGNYFKANDKEQKKGYPASFVRTDAPTKR